MKNKLSLLALAAIPLVSIAQEGKYASCSHVKSHPTPKSNTFSIAQIAETERYDVHFYFLDLNMTNTTTTLSGKSEIQASARVALDSALIEFYPSFAISSVTVNGSAVSYNRTGSALKVPVNAAAGANFSVVVNYSGTPPSAATNPLGGGGMTNDNSPTWGNQVTWSLSEPFAAYEWFPVKQSLKDKADSCAFWITVPNACKAGSNGLLQQVTDLGNGTHRFEWKHRHPIDYYLISVAVAEYVEYTVTANPAGSGPVLIQNYIYNNPGTLNMYQDDIDETADFIELYADLFGPYPFADEKYGHCMAPISGGMEHQTMTTQGFFDPALTAHELAHQWWGDHVTCASWSDIWMNEGFASYAEYLMLAELYPGEQITSMLNIHNDVMSEPDGSVWVEDSLNDGRIFSGRLTYNKGSAIIHTLRFLINDDVTFFDGLRQYQALYADSTASGLDFIHVMEDVADMDFTNFMQEWYFGEGYPTYQVRWKTSGDNLILRLNQTVSQSGVTPFFTNDVPVRFIRSGAPDTVIRFPVTGTLNDYQIAGMGNVTSVPSIDPENWIVNRTNGIINDQTLAISEFEDKAQISVFPNPSNGPFTVEMPEEGNYSISILDSKGRVLKTSSFTKKTILDLGSEASGSYLIQITSADGSKIRRIIKK